MIGVEVENKWHKIPGARQITTQSAETETRGVKTTASIPVIQATL